MALNMNVNLAHRSRQSAEPTSLVQGRASAAVNPTDQTQELNEFPVGEAGESLSIVHAILRAALDRPVLSIYEAGGGSTSFLPSDVLDRANVTVVDVDEEQLSNNDYAQHKILGDIQTYQFPRESFDLVTCYNVIEHLPDVEAALQRFCESVRRGGIVLIGAPNPASLSGIVTRFSPHWFHVWYYRRIRGKKDAGKPGEPPFPVFYHPLVWPHRLKSFARSLGLEVLYERKYESPRYPEMRDRMPLLAAAVDASATLLNAMFLMEIDVRRGDYHLVLRKL
jgi:SAM-dependent methyltransferase